MAVITERQRVNLVSLLVTVGVLFVAVRVSSGSFATRINKISENLDRALSEVLDQRLPNFTELTDNATYVSDASFDSRGMAGLYNFTVAFINLILPKDIYPEGFLTIDPNHNTIHLGDYQQEWKSLLGQYKGILTMIIILGLLIVFMPLCGMCFCCCRCCGRCGARSQPFDKKHDLCKKCVLATVLIGLGTMLLFGVVCAFVSNQQMKEGVDDLTGNLRKGLKDVDTYLDTTKGQIDTLLNINYGQFETVLIETINESSDIVYDELANYSNATSMTELANVVDKLPGIRDGFIVLKYSTNSLRVYASQLSDAVRKVKKDMLEILKSPECDSFPKCKEINKNVSSLQTNIHFNNLPDISDQMSQLDNFMKNNDLFDAVKNGKEKLENIKNTIGEKVNETLKEARVKITEAGDQIRLATKNVTDAVGDLQHQIDVNTGPAVTTADEYITLYGAYPYYGALAISCVLLLITICIALGLICGICGKRPEGYGDDCCNKGTGSDCLVCGVIFMFLLGFIVSVVVLVCFVVGVVTQRVACDPLRDPTNSQLFTLIDKMNLSDYYINFNISTALESCYQNKSIYEVFYLKSRFDLDDVENFLVKIKDTLATLNLGSIDILKNFTILSEADKNVLKEFANSGFADINFDEFKDLLNTNFTTVNLTDLSTELGDLIDEMPNSASDLINQLTVNKMNIEMYQEKIVEPMIKNATAVIELAKTVEGDLRLGHGSFNESMNLLLDELERAEQILTVNGTEFLNKTVIQFTNGIVKQVQTYIDRVVDKIKNDVGRCGPISLVIDATLTSTCDKILLPWNGYWFSLFWSVLLFVPTIIVSVKLATLYKKRTSYSSDLVEANGKSKKKNKKHKRYEDRPAPSAGGDMVVREYAAGSNHQDARYADMAPKQWEDFPAGGPPQYQRAPTEYERPPPYYYPGAGDNAQ